MGIMKLVALASIVTVAACSAPAPDQPAHWVAYGSTDFTPAEHQAIEAAAADIELQTSGAVTVDIIWSGDPAAADIRKEPYRMIGNLPAGAIAYSRTRGEVVFFSDRMPKDLNRWHDVALHELMHHFGVGHLQRGLMAPWSGASCIDDEAMTELQKFHVIPSPKPCAVR